MGHRTSAECFGVGHWRDRSLYILPKMLCLVLALGMCQPALGQSIIAAPDGTKTVVTPSGDRFIITGGSTSPDGQNLFHSFEQFGLAPHEIAEFWANSAHRNILTRVVGGDPSIINGQLAILGGSPNLYLMNPAGIVFGQQAQLDLPAAFTATTAHGIEFASGTFTVDYQTHYATLVGSPQTYIFEGQATGVIINAADLRVATGESLSLVGGTVFNTGTAIAPGGNIQIIGVPNSHNVRIQAADSLLSLEVALPQPTPQTAAIAPLSLPELLTGGHVTAESVGVELNADGQIYTPGAEIAPPTTNGSVTISGAVSVSDQDTVAAETSSIHHPQIRIDGDRIGLFSADITASSLEGGGKVRVGETAQRTFVDAQSTIAADVLGAGGHGGDILIWSEEATAAYGHFSARGGQQDGDGGFVEVSSRGQLAYDGSADLAAPNGQWGTFYLDPQNITIVAGGPAANDSDLPNIFESQDPGVNYTISATALQMEMGTVILEASGSITVDAALTSLNSSHLILRAPSLFVNDPISTVGDLTLASDSSALSQSIQGGTGGSPSTLTLETFTLGNGIRLGGTGSQPLVNDVSDTEISFLSGFQTIVLGSAGNSGTLIIEDTTATRNLLSGVTLAIAGAGELQGLNQDTTWNLTGANQGTFNAFGQTVNFSNVAQIMGGSNQDTFIFNDGVNFQGRLDGGLGTDSLDYSRYTTSISTSLPTNQATGTTGVFNIETVTPPTNILAINARASLALLQGVLPNLNTDITLRRTQLAANLGLNIDLYLSLKESISATLPRRSISQQLDENDLDGAIASLDAFFGSEFLNHFGRPTSETNLSVDEMRQILRQQSAATGSPSALIYLVVQPQHLELLLVTGEGEPIHHRTLVPQEEVLKTVRRFRQEVTDPVRRLTTSYLKPAQQLHDWLITPLENELERFGIETLLFSLDEGFRTMPLAALHDGQDFLIENYGLSVVPSLALVRQTQRRIPAPTEARVLAMGVSEFQQQQPLPAVPVEIAAVGQHLPNDTALLNEAFTWKNWQKQQQDSFDIVHIATHAEFRASEQGEDNSFIQLWDGPISLEEVKTVPWRDQQVELLVLSACRTAFGSREAEFGFAGLAVQTGVPSAIASIWYANDVGTLALMNELYRYLPQTSTRAEALRQAQLALLRRQTKIQAGQLVTTQETKALPESLNFLRNRTLNHPYYWSGFALIGSPW